MDISVLSTLIGETIPTTLGVNEFGVVTEGLHYRFVVGKLTIEIQVACQNGKWGFAPTIMGKTWGVSCPLVLDDFRWASIQQCMDVAWLNIIERLDKNSEVTKDEVFKVTKERSVWASLDRTQQLSKFKDFHFYDNLVRYE